MFTHPGMKKTCLHDLKKKKKEYLQYGIRIGNTFWRFVCLVGEVN